MELATLFLVKPHTTPKIPSNLINISNNINKYIEIQWKQYVPPVMKYCKIANNGVQPIMVDNAVTINNIKKVQIVTYHEILY